MTQQAMGRQRLGWAATCLGCAALLTGAAARLEAQTTASIFGTVTDESGAVVLGAAIRAINTLTNEVRTTASNQLGYYTLPELPVGTYTVRVELEGFKTTVRDGIVLSLNRNARVDVRLNVGALTEQVSVTADAPLVETATNEMGTLVDQRRITELPLLGRNTLALVSLIPGAQNLQEGNPQGFAENFVSINGIREEQSNWRLDGGESTSPLRNYGNPVPNPEAIEEFRVVSNNYSAEYGRAAGAVVNVITRSGTNRLHGSLFEFLRNRRLNARNFFEADTTPLVRNQFGGSLGGPVTRDRTFFFGSYQGFRRRTSSFYHGALVPTAAERQGDFSQSVDRNENPVRITDPLTRRPFPNNVIPPERLSQVARNYLDLAIPLPNYPVTGPNGLYQIASVPRDSNEFLAKLDHLFSEKHKLSGAYFFNDIVDGQRFLQEIDFARRDFEMRQHNLNLHEYWTISPSKLNHFRATFSRSAGNRRVTPDDVTMNDLGAKFSPLPEGPKMPPSFQVSGYFNAGTAYGGPKVGNDHVLADTFSWITGRHDLRFGVEGTLKRLMDVSTAPRQAGQFTFDGSATGNGLADLMLGLVNRLDVGNQTYKSNNSWLLHWFVQDRFRVTSRLVLNLGLRHEVNTWPVHPLDALVAYLPGRQSNCVPQAPPGIVFPCDAGVPRAGARGDYNNLAPRFGFAYDLFGNGKTVIRAGYGISHTVTIFNALQEGQVSVPFQLQDTIRNTTLEDPYAPIGGSPFPFHSDPTSLKFPASSNYQFQDFNMRTGYIQQYNLSVQHQLGNDWSVDLAYVGNLGRKLIGQVDINSPLSTADATNRNIDQRRPLYPTFRQMSMIGGFVNSSYNAFQARVEKRFSRGFTVLGSYTFGKAIDEASWYASRSYWADPRNRWLDKGRGENDRSHLFALSWVWELPFYAASKGVAATLLGGWSVNGIAALYSGQPIQVLSGRDNNYDGTSGNDRPDVVGNWKLSPNRSRDEVIARWFNPDAFRANQGGQLGNLGRNVVVGPGIKNVNLAITKNVTVTEGHQVQFRCEMVNAFNFVNLAHPVTSLTRGTFGSITEAGAPRIFQLGLRYNF